MPSVGGQVSVLVLLGSLRAASVNRQIAELAVAMAPDGVTLTVFDRLAELPFYNEDLDTAEALPAAAAALRQAGAGADGVLVITPEYNGSIPAVLKNAIDWFSRPLGARVLNGKPLAVIGAALGRYGGVWAHDETRKSFALAGPRVIDEIALAVPIGSLEGRHPRDHAELVRQVRDVVVRLTAATR